MKNAKPIETPGYFWLPELPDNKVPGTLSVSKYGEISLDTYEVFGNQESEINKIFNSEHEGFSRIYGIVRDGGYVTLVNCNYQKVEMRFGPGKMVLGARTAFVGVNFELDELSFQMYDFCVEGLSEWLGISGIMTSVDTSGRIGTINVRKPDPVSFNLPDNITLEFGFTSTGMPLAAYQPITDVHIIQTPYISLNFSDPMPFEYFTSLATKMTNFLSLAIDQNVQIQSVKTHVVRDDISGNKPYYATVDVYHTFYPISDRSAIVRRHEFLFDYPNTRNLGKLMAKWLDIFRSDAHGNALDSFFTSRSSNPTPLSTRFLSLCQCLEALHGKTFSDERIVPSQDFDPIKTKMLKLLPRDFPDSFKSKIGNLNLPSLRDRLESLVAPLEEWFGGEQNSRNFAKQVADTRNRLTHLHDRNWQQARNPQELRDLYDKLDALATLRVLMLLGLDKPDLTALMQNTSNRLNQVLAVNDSD
ncbi:MAG: hypothetical protein OXM02_03205 [Bacteroidota bacterium]|nr:hypothetical protein [Bacteroidota bacterium]